MKYLLTLLWLLGAIAAQAQEYTGHVADKEDGAPVAGAIVTARDSLGKPLGYTTTSASGDFVLRPRGGGTTAQLDFSSAERRKCYFFAKRSSREGVVVSVGVKTESLSAVEGLMHGEVAAVFYPYARHSVFFVFVSYRG